MKRIKLASLAVAMVISAVGAYANYRSATQVYNIVPGTLAEDPSYEVASVPPSNGCGGNASYVCTVIAPNGYISGQSIPAGDATIFTKYN